MWCLIVWCKRLSNNSMEIFLNTKINLAWNHQESVKKSCTSLLVRYEIACRWCPHLGLWKHRDVEEEAGQATVRAITLRAVLVVSETTSRNESSREYKPAWMIDVRFCSSGQTCFTGFQHRKWRLKRLCVHTRPAEMRIQKKKASWASSVTAITVYIRIVFLVKRHAHFIRREMLWSRAWSDFFVKLCGYWCQSEC